MADHHERKDEKGFTARYLILMFVMFVAACAVFFSLGFLVGYNERPSSAADVAEEVTPTGTIPPPVNAPPEGAATTPPPAPTVAANGLPTEHIVTPPSAAKAAPAPVAKPSAPAPKTTAKTSAAKTAAPKTSTTSSRTKEKAGFTVQVTASRDKKDAEKLVKELRSRGFDVFVVPPQYSDAKDNLYRVQVGPYATRGEAVRVRDRIAKEGFKPFIKN
jgi:cell division septation protein DedD